MSSILRGQLICDTLATHDIPATFTIYPGGQLYVIVNKQTVLGHVYDVPDPCHPNKTLHMWQEVRPVMQWNSAVKFVQL